ncbi:septation ring formation regulator EzrA [Micromonospora sp. S4605]|uniref:FtsB family cell division protein n=1 Tax=Micromonospora sp. S4605 TaxID=1420897 RepID=UPI000D6F88B2|nr:septum formation initiator family protein [Micromonospora sp. S4605]PWU52774.1 septation ring formation regulator EzrA [Micromonospora sp. S4605]
MTPRLTPGGQGPARRSGQRRRAAPSRTGRPVARGATANESADTRRSANRPAARRTMVRRTNVPQPRHFTGRATVLLAVLVALALAYTYPVRVYLSQQSDIARMEQAQAEQRQRISDLSKQAALWKDKKYIETQARERLLMVHPGERLLVVITAPEGATPNPENPADTRKSPPADPWYETLWSSIQAADAESDK